VRSGGTPSAANQLFAQSVAAGDTYVPPALPTLAAGDMIQAKADAGAVVTCAGISGYVFA